MNKDSEEKSKRTKLPGFNADCSFLSDHSHYRDSSKHDLNNAIGLQRAGARRGNVAAGARRGNVAAGARRGNVAAGARRGNVGAGARRGNVTQLEHVVVMCRSWSTSW